MVSRWSDCSKQKGTICKLKAVPVKPCFLIRAKGSVDVCVEDVTYHAYVSFCCQSGGVKCILEQLSFHMILNKRKYENIRPHIMTLTLSNTHTRTDLNTHDTEKIYGLVNVHSFC